MRHMRMGGYVTVAMASAALLAIPPSPALASPAAPAREGAGIHTNLAAAPAAATDTVTFIAQATSSGKISAQDVLPSVTCTLTIDPPTAGGLTFADSYVKATASIFCRYDRDGSPANASVIDLTTQLVSADNQFVKGDRDLQFGMDHARTNAPTYPCLHGSWTNNTQVAVTPPPGYTPPQLYAQGSTDAFIGLGDCPGDRVEVPDVTGESVSRATADLQAAGLVAGAIGSTVSCDVPKNTIASTDPSAGTVVLLGTVVTMRKSVGLPATPCP